MKPRLSHALIAGALVWASVHYSRANAESFFQAEVGLGIQQSKDMGDGTWIQTSPQTPHNEQLRSPAFLVGARANLWTGAEWDVKLHADYFYFGTISASCTCVPDSVYNPHTHTASQAGYIPFSGSGHTQGIALTLETGYTWHGYRLAAEAGPVVFWATWHETRFDPAYPTETNLSHRTVAQLGAVFGARVERGNFGLSYRYYYTPQRWNPYPALATGTHMLMATWRF